MGKSTLKPSTVSTRARVETASAPPDERATVAVILRPRGLRGEVVALMQTDFPERFDELSDVWLAFPDGTVRPAKLESHWFHKSDLILKFEGIDSRTAVEPLAKAKVQVPISERVELDEDEFFVDALIGCRVESSDGKFLGEVVEVADMGGGETLVVRPTGEADGTEYLIPFVRDICSEVDLEARRIRATLPEGLLESQR